ncbi:GAF and ANTAR domain-containing protein [Streptomyces sp. CC219B]|uniref:GAF and ANTAR domain-containing protein n=1 Tax=Streptomyces sp. CC219B TaxID=3044574 RepID=UPI0024A88791|nr:GAF and ANTAR domain-containing protein [Streptomyces sp. CC219B]
MATGGPVPDRLASARRRAAAARARAAQESGDAERREELAAAAASEAVRDMHLRITALHRSTASRHLTAARLQEAYAERLSRAGDRPGDPQPLFMTGVAAACGTGSAALMLVGTALDQLAVAASDETARTAQELEFLLGEGPARDATRELRPVSVSGAALAARWPGYGRAVAELGIAEVAAVPLSVAGVCFGALSVFDPGPGVTGSTAFAEVAAALAHSMVLRATGEPDLYGGMDVLAVVHQAAGMLAVRLDCSVADALELIKARSFAEGVSALSVAERILTGRPTLDWPKRRTET